MVRNHPVMDILVAIRVNARRIGRGLDQRFEQVGVVIVVAALHQRRNAFQPHAGVNRLHVQRPHRAIFKLLVLHENDVPDLDEPIAIFLRRARRATPDLIAMVIENFGARPARTGRPHLPEIIRRRDADDPFFRNAELFPDVECLVIRMVNRHRQAVLVDPEILGDQVPREGDRLLLEIIAEAEIAEHLEKRVVPRRVADIIQIIMLAPGPHAFLRRGGAGIVACLQPGEQILELHHPRIDKHQRRVVARHKRAGRLDRMAMLFEIGQEGGPDVVQAGHRCVHCA